MRDALALWMTEVNQDAGRSPQTRQFYRRVVRQTLLGRFGSTRVADMKSGAIDRYLKELRQRTPAQARNAKVVLRMVLAMCVRDEALSANPIANVERKKRSREELRRAKVRALTLDDVAEMRRLLRVWRRGSGTSLSGAPRDPSFLVTDVFEVAIGTGLRIGELLALRPCDLNLEGDLPTLEVTGTLVTVDGAGGLYRQPFPKTPDSERIIALPEFVVAALRRQLELNGSTEYVFTTGNGTPVSPNNVRRAWRQAREGTSLDWVTPHSLRKSVATLLDGTAGLSAAAGQLGHGDERITRAHYIAKNQAASNNAELLNRLLSPGPEAGKSGESDE
jgi:integrase